jgi:hypothetical protein
VQPRPAAPPAAVPSMPETELEQATLLSAAIGAYGCGEMFYAFVSSSLQQLRERRAKVPMQRAEPVAQGPPPAQQAVYVAAAPASPAEPPTPTEPSADLGECAEALLQLSRTTRRRPRDAGAPSADAQTTWSAWSSSPAMDPSAVTVQLKKAEASGDINSNSCLRLEALQELLIKCQTDGILTFEVDRSPCILGWSKMLVKNPAEFNYRIREMIRVDLRGVCHRCNGKEHVQLRNPTWGLYELLRKIGVKPKSRCPPGVEGDPGKHDMVYYREWCFINDESFRTARLRLCKGYSYDPEKGGRERKRMKVGEKPV